MIDRFQNLDWGYYGPELLTAVLSLIHISEPTRLYPKSIMPSSSLKNFFNDTATTEIYTVDWSSAASDVYKRQQEVQQ